MYVCMYVCMYVRPFTCVYLRVYGDVASPLILQASSIAEAKLKVRVWRTIMSDKNDVSRHLYKDTFTKTLLKKKKFSQICQISL